MNPKNFMRRELNKKQHIASDFNELASPKLRHSTSECQCRGPRKMPNYGDTAKFNYADERVLALQTQRPSCRAAVTIHRSSGESTVTRFVPVHCRRCLRTGTFCNSDSFLSLYVGSAIFNANLVWHVDLIETILRMN